MLPELCLLFPVVLFKFSPCSALVIKSLRHKAGSMGSVYSFPKSIILHINHWSGTFGQCWICAFAHTHISHPRPHPHPRRLLCLCVWQFPMSKLHKTQQPLHLTNYFVSYFKNWFTLVAQQKHHETKVENELLILKAVVFLLFCFVVVSVF